MTAFYGMSFDVITPTHCQRAAFLGVPLGQRACPAPERQIGAVDPFAGSAISSS
jgi:hypothetical protein